MSLKRGIIIVKQKIKMRMVRIYRRKEKKIGGVESGAYGLLAYVFAGRAINDSLIDRCRGGRGRAVLSWRRKMAVYRG